MDPSLYPTSWDRSSPSPCLQGCLVERALSGVFPVFPTSCFLWAASISPKVPSPRSPCPLRHRCRGWKLLWGHPHGTREQTLVLLPGVFVPPGLPRPLSPELGSCLLPAVSSSSSDLLPSQSPFTRLCRPRHEPPSTQHVCSRRTDGTSVCWRGHGHGCACTRKVKGKCTSPLDAGSTGDARVPVWRGLRRGTPQSEKHERAESS